MLCIFPIGEIKTHFFIVYRSVVDVVEVFFSSQHKPPPCEGEEKRHEYSLVVKEIVGGCLGVERVELTLYLLCLA